MTFRFPSIRKEYSTNKWTKSFLLQPVKSRQSLLTWLDPSIKNRDCDINDNCRVCARLAMGIAIPQKKSSCLLRSKIDDRRFSHGSPGSQSILYLCTCAAVVRIGWVNRHLSVDYNFISAIRYLRLHRLMRSRTYGMQLLIARRSSHLHIKILPSSISVELSHVG